jgi:hypothetical protein
MFLNGCTTSSFSRRAQLHGVSYVSLCCAIVIHRSPWYFLCACVCEGGRVTHISMCMRAQACFTMPYGTEKNITWLRIGIVDIQLWISDSVLTVRCNHWALNDITALSDETTQAHALNLLVLLLPAEYRSTLRALFRFLARVVQNQKYNKMSVHNVAMIIAPSVFSPQ